MVAGSYLVESGDCDEATAGPLDGDEAMRNVAAAGAATFGDSLNDAAVAVEGSLVAEGCDGAPAVGVAALAAGLVVVVVASAAAAVGGLAALESPLV